MNSRQRVKAALNHQQPDRVPMDLGATIVSTMQSEVYNELKKHLGIDTPPVKGSGPSKRVFVETEVMEQLQTDTKFVQTKPPHNSGEVNKKTSNNSEGYYRNEWGVEYKVPPGEKYCYVPLDAPMVNASVDDINAFDWPDPSDPGRTKGLRTEADTLNNQNKYAIVGNVDKPSIFEIALQIRGFEQFLADMAMNVRFATRLLDKITEIQIIRYEKMLEQTGRYLDVIVFGDDVGMQHGPLVSPKMYRNMIKPLHKALYDAIRKKTNAKIFYHSCGDCYSLIPDFIEIGVDILNPIQVSAENMETDRLKREFAKELCFWGAIDTQHVLPHGSTEDVRKEVRKRVGDLADNGGYVLAPVHNIVNDVPPENITAMYDEVLNLQVSKMNID